MKIITNAIPHVSHARFKNFSNTNSPPKAQTTTTSPSDILICVPAKSTPRIQESHILLGHALCEVVEDKLFQN